MTAREGDLTLILYRPPGVSKWEMWACRGAGKGCKRNKTRKNLKPCEDCFGPLPEDMTLEEVTERLSRGDA